MFVDVSSGRLALGVHVSITADRSCSSGGGGGGGPEMREKKTKREGDVAFCV